MPECRVVSISNSLFTYVHGQETTLGEEPDTQAVSEQEKE
jgi:hypothetical protein